MEKLRMQLFGSFILSKGEVSLGEEELCSNKLIRLLSYVLIHRDSVLTQQKLIELFLEDSSKNPENALRNLMYRLRSELKVFGEERYIWTLQGAYRWNPEIEVETDYEEFEKMAARLRNPEPDDTPEERKTLCGKMISCYRGNITGKIAYDSWMLPKAAWYQSLYMEAVKTLCTIYEKEENWASLELLSSQAAGMDSFDEDLQCWKIRSLHRQKKYDDAMVAYEKVKRMFYENMGIHESEKLKAVFWELMSSTERRITDLHKLLKDARESEKPKGLYFCDYQIFREIYRIEMRRVERLGIAEYVMLLTVRRTTKLWKEALADQGLIEGVTILEGILNNSLRIGDAAARYSPTQFIVLLPGCTYENAGMVAERVQKSFRKKIGKRHLELLAELAEIPGFR